MLRITELRLPLNHPEPALPSRCWRARARPTLALRQMTIAAAGCDARRKSDIVLVFGEGGATCSPTASSTARSRTPKFYGQGAGPSSSRPAPPEEILYVSKPHIGTFRLTGVVEDARRDRTRWAARSVSRARHRPDIERDARRTPRRGAGERRRRRHRPPWPRPQRARHLPDAARAACIRSQAVFHRFAHRASAIDDRPRAPRPGRRPSLLGAADYKLVHHAATAARSTLLHVPGRHGGGGHVRSRTAWSPTA